MIYKALDEYSKRDLNPHSHYWPKDFKSFVSTIPPFEHPQKRRAENETRTRDPNLGKVMLYQLSYFRRFLENGCKDKQFTCFCQIFSKESLKNYPSKCCLSPKKCLFSFFHPTEIETFNGLLHQCGDFGIT